VLLIVGVDIVNTQSLRCRMKQTLKLLCQVTLNHWPRRLHASPVTETAYRISGDKNVVPCDIYLFIYSRFVTLCLQCVDCNTSLTAGNIGNIAQSTAEIGNLGRISPWILR